MVELSLVHEPSNFSLMSRLLRCYCLFDGLAERIRQFFQLLLQLPLGICLLRFGFDAFGSLALLAVLEALIGHPLKNIACKPPHFAEWVVINKSLSICFLLKQRFWVFEGHTPN